MNAFVAALLVSYVSPASGQLGFLFGEQEGVQVEGRLGQQFFENDARSSFLSAADNNRLVGNADSLDTNRLAVAD